MSTITMVTATTTPVRTGRAVGVRPAVDRLLLACGCGQALDVCHASHCPRCGVRLAAPRLAVGSR